MTIKHIISGQADTMNSKTKKRAEFDLSKMLKMQNDTRLTATPARPFYDVNWHLIACDKTPQQSANTNIQID